MTQTATAKQSGTSLLDGLRHSGAAAMQAHGLPTTRHEKWKYTSLKPIADMTLAPDRRAGAQLAAADVPVLLPTVTEALTGTIVRLTIVNGVYRADLSDLTHLPDGMTVYDFATAATQHAGWLRDYLPTNGFLHDQFLLALNTQYAQDGFVLHVAKNASCADTTVLVQHVTLGRGGELKHAAMSHSRCVLIVEPGASATVAEIMHGQQTYATNLGFDIHVADNATLHHYRWQNDTQQAAHFVTANVTVGNSASYDHFCLMTGAKLARHDVRAALTGAHAECRINGVYLAAAQQHTDTTILIEHYQPHGTSNQTFKGIVNDHAKAVFQGKVHVHRPAQKTDGYQLNNALLLSRTAEIDVKPELEIYADDVRCSHGATTGQLDLGPLFYLRSRGLSEAEAKTLLMQAFLGPALDEIRSETVRDLFTTLAMHWVGQQAQAMPAA